MKNLSIMSSSQLQDIKYVLTDIDDTLTSDGKLKSNAYPLCALPLYASSPYALPRPFLAHRTLYVC